MFRNNVLTTISNQYHVVRGLGVDSATVDLTSEGDFAQLPTTNILDLFKKDAVTPRDADHFPEYVANGLCFIFAGTTAADKVLAWRLLAWRNGNGPAEIVAYGTATTGTQAVVTWPHNGETATDAYWCDTITITAEYWPKEIEATAAGGNSVSKLFLDSCGYRYWKMEITLPGGGTDITYGACYYGYF